MSGRVKQSGRARRNKIRAMTRGHCHLCDFPVAKKQGGPLGETIDHLIPVSHGGTDKLSNLRIAHRFCNELRATLPIFDALKREIRRAFRMKFFRNVRMPECVKELRRISGKYHQREDLVRRVFDTAKRDPEGARNLIIKYE